MNAQPNTCENGGDAIFPMSRGGEYNAGMTLRQHYAGLMMAQGFLHQLNAVSDGSDVASMEEAMRTLKSVAVLSLMATDALLAEQEKPQARSDDDELHTEHLAHLLRESVQSFAALGLESSLKERIHAALTTHDNRSTS